MLATEAKKDLNIPKDLSNYLVLISIDLTTRC